MDMAGKTLSGLPDEGNRCLRSLAPLFHPKSGLPDFGINSGPKSGKPDFG